MAPETLSPMLVLRRGVVCVAVARGARVVLGLRPNRLFRTGRAVVAVVLGGPLRRCIRLGLALACPCRPVVPAGYSVVVVWVVVVTVAPPGCLRVRSPRTIFAGGYRRLLD